MPRIVRFHQTGGPEVLQIEEEQVAAPARGELQIKVHALGLNRAESMFRSGQYLEAPHLPARLGYEAAGSVSAVGEGVSGFSVGDAVSTVPAFSQNQYGVYGELVNVPVNAVEKHPATLSWIEAAAVWMQYLTAYGALVDIADTKPGEYVLIPAASSSVGLAAIQIARHLRQARVIATASTEKKRQVCRSAGAELAVDYRDDWATQIRTHTAGRGVDVILDGQAGPYTERELDLLAADGRLVLIASHLGATAEVNVRNIVRRRLTLTGSTLRPRPPEYKGRIARELVEQVWPLIEDGRIRTLIDATFPLDDVARAHALLDGNEQVGKVVLIVDPALAARSHAGTAKLPH